MAKLLHHQFDQQARKTPNYIALRGLDSEMTYAQLEQRANVFASKLIESGVKPGDVVGVFMTRGVNLVAALLGTLKAGACYLPLDPYYPQERLCYMVKHSQAELVITDNPSEVNWLPISCRYLDIGQIDFLAATGPIEIEISDDALCYVMYTSGSTGQPKGVMVCHRTVVNYIQWMKNEFHLTREDCVLNQTTFSFDISVWEMFWPIFVGASCALISEDEKYDPGLLAEFIRIHYVTVAQFVPTALRTFVDAGELGSCSSLKHIFSGGEALPQSLVDDVSVQYTGHLHNLYGPTEATIFACHWYCQPKASEKVVPIGRPIPHAKAYVLDDNLDRVPVGERGELYLAGDILAKGYLKQSYLTAQRFVDDPFSRGNGHKMYRTGDIASVRSDGALQFHGRTDSQVKLRGHRIELAEIEAQLLALPGISQAAVVVNSSDDSAAPYITAFYVSPPQCDVNIETIRELLAKVLPYYMLPSRFYCVDRLPTLPNGKVSRAKLTEHSI
ncbi:amino acid adenylation domain-containing protein [Vibrio sp. S4M6]|uniref:non-ribosomal peptide synthetase n=1 Tax=Vibrio sinus TaxID=2946865 RepID=UPI00202A539B|nr:amino acid adenylation domain-containing protein [Vibrio sinus]MCL9779890.1 amino acid adenylation domain-containing protein [Vibrio sinus]